MADIAQVSHLSLHCRVLMSLSRVDVPHTLRVHFRQLRCLKFVGNMVTMDRRMYQVFCGMLRSMPLLETLEIEHYCPEHLEELDPIPPNEYTKKQSGFGCLDKTLRRVTINMCRLTSIGGIMWMIRFILMNANVLELIKITYGWDDDHVKSRILEELCELEKASSAARVVVVYSELAREHV